MKNSVFVLLKSDNVLSKENNNVSIITTQFI